MVDITDIKRLAKEIENKYDLNYYEILQRYMFERVLERNDDEKSEEKTIKEEFTEYYNIKVSDIVD